MKQTETMSYVHLIGTYPNGGTGKNPLPTLRMPLIALFYIIYRGADKSLARPTSRCILFDGENISFDASLIICIYTGVTGGKGQTSGGCSLC